MRKKYCPIVVTRALESFWIITYAADGTCNIYTHTPGIESMSDELLICHGIQDEETAQHICDLHNRALATTSS